MVIFLSTTPLKLLTIFRDWFLHNYDKLHVTAVNERYSVEVSCSLFSVMAVQYNLYLTQSF